MAIEKDTYFKVVCDVCGEAFPEHESGGGYTLFNSEDEARREVEYADGEVRPDGKVHCGECVYEKRTDKSLSETDQPGEESSRGRATGTAES
jgi:hypothetical protein